MYQGQIRTIVATIILGGHFLVFFFGLLLGVFGPLLGSDAVQIVLMASPVLAATATAALMFALKNELEIKQGARVTSLFASVTIFFPSMLLLCLFITFYAVYIQLPGFGPDQMKITLGSIETFFGVFLGAISDTLFGAKIAVKSHKGASRRGRSENGR